MSEWSCPFCGKSGVKRTKEHILPRHLKSKIETTTGPTHVFSDDPATGKMVREFVIDHSPLEMTIREVCVECNNGWMSQVESELDETLVRLAGGEMFPLDGEEAERLRFWAAKTALVVTLREKDIEKTVHLSEMFATKGVPRGITVQYCICTDIAPNPVPRHTTEEIQVAGRRVTANDRVHLVCFGLGRAFFMVSIAGRRRFAEYRAKTYLRAVKANTDGWVRLISSEAAPAPRVEVPPGAAYINGSIMRDILTGELDALGTETRPEVRLHFPAHEDGTVNLNEEDWPEFFAATATQQIAQSHPLFGRIDLNPVPPLDWIGFFSGYRADA